MIKLGIWSKLKRFLFPEILRLNQSNHLLETRLELIENRLQQYNIGKINNSKISDKCRLYPKYNLIDSEIGDYTYVAANSNISMTTIGKFCSIGPNFVCGWGIHPTNGISTAPMFYSTQKQNGITLALADRIEERMQIEIGNDVFIGMNVSILDGVKVGDGAVIGAGAIVSKDIPPYAVAVGNPIQIIKYRFSEDQIQKLLKIKWWDFEDKNLGNVEKYFLNVDEFINKHINL